MASPRVVDMAVDAASYIRSHLGLTVTVCVVLYFISQRYKTGLRHIPGPFVASFSGFWRAWEVAKGDWHVKNLELHRQYGPLVRIAPNVISVSDPDALRVIYGLNSGFTKTDFYPIQEMKYGKIYLANLFSTKSDEFHAKQKRSVATAYSMTSMLAFEPYVDNCSELFFKRLDELYVNPHQPCDLGKWLQLYAMDVIAEVTFGKRFGCMQEGGDVGGLIDTIDKFLVYASVVGQVPYLHKFLFGNPLLPYILPKLDSINHVVKFTLERISEREKDSERHKDFLGRLYDAKAEGKMEAVDIVRHSSANVFAGSDTTAIALRAAIDGLLANPECYRKLQAEIDQKRAEGKLSLPVKYAEAQQMPYLQAVLKEGMRYHPSVSFLLERHVPKGGTVVCGTRVPEDTIVGVNAWVVHRDRKVFGDDADVFRPERWLEADEAQLKAMERAFFVFGGGSRTCTGRNISLMEMSKVIPSLLMVYDIERADPKARTQTKTYWFAVQRGLVCNIRRRREREDSKV
ncbi:Pisatin demethylase [Fonsecaea pedrosoi]|nr:Pisatin demethylase [Fonsecaea pedrosoi]